MENKLVPAERITKPIQLLAAWLFGLLSINGVFLATATRMEADSWQSGALTIAAIINVPLFIGALFLLQTKFRPELQEDSYYSTYLNNRTNEVIKIPGMEDQYKRLSVKLKNMEERLAEPSKQTGDANRTGLTELSFGVNVHLDNRDTIEAKINEIGIPIIKSFGEESEKPPLKVVAVAQHLPTPIKNEVFRLAQDLGFEYYSHIELFEEIDEDVLFGAYGKSEGRILPKKPNDA